jgi:hypothetical protein
MEAGDLFGVAHSRGIPIAWVGSHISMRLP